MKRCIFEMNPNQSCHVSRRGCRTQIHSAPLFIHSKKTCSVEEWSHISDKEFLFLTLQVLCCRNRCGFVFPASKGNHLQVGDTEDRPPFINIESVIFIGWLDGWMLGWRVREETSLMTVVLLDLQRPEAGQRDAGL